MLSYLKVSDLALVEGVEVEFREGLNVLTGETGAGKTVLVGAIGLLLGDRADAGMVRTGASETVLEACFDLSGAQAARAALVEAGYLEAGESELALWRRISRDGKGRSTVNGRTCPVAALAEIGDCLVEVHGQNTHQALLKQSTHSGYLDRFCGEAHLKALAAYRESYAHLRSLIEERLRLRAESDSAREAELLAHEVAEIESGSPEPGELEALETEAARLRHSKELVELAGGVEDVLRGEQQSSLTVGDLIARASADLERMASRDPSTEALARRAESLSLEVDDLAREVAGYREAFDADPDSLVKLESRISTLRDLCRKYGGSIDSALEYMAGASARLDAIRAASSRAGHINAEIDCAAREALERAAGLSAERKKGAKRLTTRMMEQLKGLELSHARFSVEIGQRQPTKGSAADTGAAGPDGTDEVEFMFSPEKAEPPRPLRRIASGGEMARVMLALKIVLAGADRLPVLVFDEVDSGIGGATATRVGEKLHALTAHHQVFCVTHLPQIASYADWHFAVFRQRDGAASSTGVALLDGEDRAMEICRMMGDASGRPVALEHARDILARARGVKDEADHVR